MNCKNPKKPYLYQGEIISYICKSLDLKENRQLKRFQKGDYGYQIKNQLLNDIIFKQIKSATNENTAQYVHYHISEFLHAYIELVIHIPMEGLNRDECLDCLNKWFVYSFAVFYADFYLHFGGPKPEDLLTSERSIDFTFKWIENNFNEWNNLYSSLDKTHKDQIRKWCNGSDLPAFDTVKKYHKWFTKKFDKNNSNQIKTIILISRAIDYFKKSEKGKKTFEILRKIILSGDIDNMAVNSTSQMLSISERSIISKYHEYYKDMIQLGSYLDPSTTKKQVKEKSLLLLNRIKSIENNKREDLIYYFTDWMEGRWNIYNRQFDIALEFYQRAYENCLYCGGENQRKIMHEFLLLASKCKKKPLINRIKTQMICFGYLYYQEDIDAHELNTAKSRSPHSFVQDFEIERWASQFNITFRKGFDGDMSGDGLRFGPWMCLDVNKIKPDFGNPNRKFKIGDTWDKQVPQINWFIQMDKPEIVKILLEKGATVNTFSESVESPLLMSIEECVPTNDGSSMNDTCFNLISERQNRVTTVNTKTLKKKKTPLISAVNTGNPDIVKKVIEMGADVNLKGTNADKPALVVCIDLLTYFWNPDEYKHYMLNNLLIKPSWLLNDLLGTNEGVFGIDLQDQYENLDKDTSVFFAYVSKEFDYKMSKLKKYTSEEKLTKIAEILLSSGADPNEDFSDQKPGYSAFYVVAQNNKKCLFEKMLNHGGNPEKTFIYNGMPKNCWDVAVTHNAHNIRRILKEKYGNKIFNV